MRKHHYAWTICLAGSLLIFITMGAVSNGFSIYLPYIRDGFGLTNAQTSTLVTMKLLVAFFCMLLIGKYYELLDIRLGMTIASCFGAVAFVMYAFSYNFTTFAIAAAVSGISYGMGSMVPVSILMNRWFVEHKALAVSICSAGSGLGSVILPPVITGLLSSLDLRTVFLMEAGFILLATLVIFILVRNNPRDMDLTRLGEYSDKLLAAAKDPKKAPKGKGSMPLIVIGSACVGCFMMGAQGNPGISHIPVLYTSVGFAPAFTATLMSIIGAALTIGKIIYGEVTDKIGGLKSSMAFCLLLIAGNGLCCLAGAGGSILAVITMIILGIGYSASTIGPSVWTADLASEEEFAQTIRRLQISYSFGALVAASIPGILADHFGGSYVPAFLMFTILSVFATVLLFLAYAKRK